MLHPLPSLLFSALLLTGGAFGQSTELLQRWDGESEYALMGISVDGAGDVNGDGTPDVIVGAREARVAGVFRAGSAYVFSGADGSQIHRWDGSFVDQWLGEGVAGPGDLNLDGYADLLVGCSNGSGGSAFAYSGLDGSLLFQWTGYGGQFGYYLSAAGDVDADGHPDMLIADYDADPAGVNRAGSVYVFSGADGSQIYRFDGTIPAQELGSSVAEAGDIDQDGHDDFIIGGAGGAFAYSGADGSILYHFTGSEPNYGEVAAGAGDLNQDGIPDLLVSAYNYSGADFYIGKVYAYSGLDGSVLYTWTGEEESDQLGYSLAPAGDLDGDGVDDVLAGALNADYQALDAGAVYAFSGADGSRIARWEGTGSFDRLGVSVAPVGDVDMDGRDDVILGAYLADLSFQSAGSAYLRSGVKDEPYFAIDQLVGGATTVVDFFGCTPNQTVAFAWSFAGAGPIPTAYGDILISPPYGLSFLPADGFGQLSLVRAVPSGLSGSSMWFHGVDLGSGQLLNAVAATVD